MKIKNLKYGLSILGMGVLISLVGFSISMSEAVDKITELTEDMDEKLDDCLEEIEKIDEELNDINKSLDNIHANLDVIESFFDEEVYNYSEYWYSVEEYFKVVKGEKYELSNNSSSCYVKVGEEHFVLSDDSTIIHEIYQKYIFDMDKVVNNTSFYDICQEPSYYNTATEERIDIPLTHVSTIYISADRAINQVDSVSNVDYSSFGRGVIGDAYQIIDGRVVKIDSNTSLNGIECDKLAFSIVSVDENNNEHVLGYINRMDIRSRYKEIDAMKKYHAEYNKVIIGKY